jgi:hypothetical protein
LRLLAGIGLALATLQILHSRHDGKLIACALLASGLLSAAIGWWEISQAELGWTSLFRTHISRMGAVLRLTGTFGYTNQAAMFMEATFPFLVAAIWSVKERPIAPWVKWPLLALLVLLLLATAQAIILTLSRAGSATVVVVCLVVAAVLAWRPSPPKPTMSWWWLGAGGMAAVLILANTLFSEQMRLRLQGGNLDDWYRAQITAPPTLEVPAGENIDIPLVIVNEGALIWRSGGPNPISLGARLLNEEGTAAYSELRWPFSEAIHPRQSVAITAPFTAPQTPGQYELRWDVVHEHIAWFGTKSGLYATSLVTVLPPLTQTAPPPPERIILTERAAWNYVGPVPNRTALWRLAAQMIGERPLFGWGMDNFRLSYGARLGNPNYDTSVHTNNFYLEMLVSLGISGAFPFMIWVGAFGLDMWHTLRRPEATMWQAAVAGGLLAFFVHGLFDFFLLFNATSLLFWLLAALWVDGKKYHAHRI